MTAWGGPSREVGEACKRLSLRVDMNPLGREVEVKLLFPFKGLEQRVCFA